MPMCLNVQSKHEYALGAGRKETNLVYKFTLSVRVQEKKKTCSFRQSVAAAAVKLLQSWLTLWDPIDSSPPGSPVPRILQARILEWVAISFSNA